MFPFPFAGRNDRPYPDSTDNYETTPIRNMQEIAAGGLGT